MLARTLGALTVLSLTTTLSANVMLTAQTRSVSASAGDAEGTVTNSTSINTAGPYDDTQTITHFGDFFGGGGTGNATQLSSVTPASISGTLHADGDGGGGVGTGFAGGTASMVIDFTVAQPLDYTLSATMTAPIGFNHAWIKLYGPDGLVIDEEIGEFLGNFGTADLTGPNARTGTLEAGDYTLDVEASASSIDFTTANTDLMISFIIPEPASAALLGLAGIALTRRH
ncbi:hypothetical protein [Mucisphaera calidilacus]|uniref:PEP-CTERM protein-sorting domain-containing protein n=1 Tax=Mucisphaera calidilacus TaxID=2527982 RepID=A0A518BWL3_9BACT|nr:hypothetical protein [Mucisphaera calidilacus]QDU71373.1 hypothetical protein Pan265_12220 [Mucisphaera calidilacus]